MNYFTKTLLSALAFGLMACGGVSDDSKLAELSDDDITDLCSEVTAETKDCSGVTISRDPNQCSAGLKNVPTSCAATAGDFRSCNDADVCEALSNASCAKIAQCSSMSGGS
jgi:hypothetical protein